MRIERREIQKLPGVLQTEFFQLFNSFTLYSVSLKAPNGLYVAYSKGQLPFDEETTQV